ncbi:VIT and VWA domain-containing protein [Pelagibius sp. Alg239-R121]|uniref:VIT and vWA domain-containing protein n=1 Tax=Pelagibius sp. Alg239-R121 TaxID=2993448 RepID=UPI0024A63B86|nr:VIT and VWA domain-containing protein [Pelagibius sp. Alg239-R121]
MPYEARKSLKAQFAGLLLAATLLGGTTGQSDAAGLLSPKDGSSPPLSIREHNVSVVIEDGYAITRIEQVFSNPHSSDFEAVYSFPVPEKAAVSEFTYWIDGQPVSGEVLEKKQARDIYEKEKAAGRETAITEQDDYRTFDISVWPVRAGQDVRVRLSYIQPAHIDTGVGRYAYPLEDGGVDEQKNAFWFTNERVMESFGFELELRSAFPLQGLRLPAHPDAKISRDAEGDWHVKIVKTSPTAGAAARSVGGAATDDAGEVPHTVPSGQIAIESPEAMEGAVTEASRLNKDIVVYWKLQDGLPASLDLVVQKEVAEGRGTFMMVLTPGDDLAPIAEGRDWVFVLDISGSMDGKFSTLAQGVSEGLDRLTPKDRFRIVYFNNGTRDSGGFAAATPENIAQAVRDLARVKPNGGTNLYAGLAHGLTQLDSDRTSGLVLVTDGVANLGETEKRSFIKLVEKQDVRLFTLVMGNSANRPLLNAISLASGGTAISVSNSDDVVGAVLSATSKLTHTALHDVTIAIDGVRTADISPKRIGSLYRGQQLVVFGHYWGGGDADVTLNAKLSGQPVSYRMHYDFPEVQTRNPEIERLWGFAAIEDLMQDMELFGSTEDGKQAVTDLAVENGLVTPFTSMVVVREKLFAQYGIDRLNRDRLASEASAQQARTSQPIQSKPVAQTGSKSAGSAFSNDRASYSGGGSGGSSGGGAGAIDPLILVFLLMAAVPLAVARFKKGERGA